MTRDKLTAKLTTEKFGEKVQFHRLNNLNQIVAICKLL